MWLKFYENSGQIILLLLLLVFSAFFSGSETAMFNLTGRQLNQLKKSKHRLQNLAAKIANRPKRLLSCLLFGNTTVNILFYATSSVLIVGLERDGNLTAAALCAIAAFCSLLLFGDIVPKSLAYGNSRTLAIAAAVPLALSLKVLSPIVSVFRFLIVDPAIRLILGPGRHPESIGTEEFKSLIEQVREQGLITADENKLLTEIIELGFLKVRHCLKPRVDMVACAVTDSNNHARQMMAENQLTKLPVYVETIDNIVGKVTFRNLLLNPDESCDKLVEPVNFVPEQKTVESLLEFFRYSRTDTAIVVDEYGGIAGSICLEDIVEELLGPIESGGQGEPIEKIGPLEYRLAGDLAVHDWASVFGIDPAETRFSTIAGLVTASLGKIPKVGDVAYMKNLKFTVEKMRKHRIETIILSREANSGGKDD